ncbi:zinc-ribbon domain-containing protein [Lactiplantibacillus pentosus]|uniref:zinc-ribbon domain-containing protein n=1 Tax=Lactiplantibacillus pentosus TaxID=1589 RepID=UPI00234BDBCC|nr:zinc-ribbon domain-containing protein [Lactiplantibacillus pentosus]MDC6397288.1 zinc-ribbon domain-containing protein [Lactiplantibacillus pentosus]
MTHCTNCGYELTPDAKFCPKCGQVVATDGLTGEASKGSESNTEQHRVTEQRVNQDAQPTPRIPNGGASPIRQTPRNNVVIVAVIAVVLILGGFFFIKNRVVVSRDQLASNITKAVQKQDSKLFLKQFSKDDQDLKYSEIGAKSVVKDMHNHSRDSLSEVGRIIIDGQRVAGTHAKYHFSVESKRVLGLFTSYYLTTRRTPIRVLDYTGSGGPVTVKLEDADNQQLSKQQLSSGFFPGKYNLKVRSGDSEDDYWIWPNGDGETIDLTLTSDD